MSLFIHYRLYHYYLFNSMANDVGTARFRPSVHHLYGMDGLDRIRYKEIFSSPVIKFSGTGCDFGWAVCRLVCFVQLALLTICECQACYVYLTNSERSSRRSRIYNLHPTPSVDSCFIMC